VKKSACRESCSCSCEGERALQGYRFRVDVPANTEAEDPTVLEDGNQATVCNPINPVVNPIPALYSRRIRATIFSHSSVTINHIYNDSLHVSA
jgi:hypothetical protein